MASSTYSAASYNRDTAVAEINVTPLVDVMLVLLVIFMVTAPVLTNRLDLRLPVLSPDRASDPPPRLNLTVRQDGGYELDGRALQTSELSAALTAAVRAQPDTVLEIGANSDAEYQAFAGALAIAQDSGVRNISTQP